MQRFEEFWANQVVVKARIAFPMFNRYFASNDYISPAEVMSFREQAVPNDSKDQKDEDIVNILVGESDLLSILHTIEGNVIICDIDQGLLDFLKWQIKFFSENSNLGFAEARSKFLEEVKKYDEAFSYIDPRMKALGNLHFLHNEQNYKRAMDALKTKKIVLLNVDLFGHREQELLCDALRFAKLNVRLFNATNLPDYDFLYSENNTFYRLLKMLPWTKRLENLIVWNIHDRGPYPRDDKRHGKINTHYLFTASSPDEYKECLKRIALLFGQVDKKIASTSEQDKNLARFPMTRFNNEMRLPYLKEFRQAMQLELPDVYKRAGLALFPRENDLGEFDIPQKYNDFCKKNSTTLYCAAEAETYHAFKIKIQKTFIAATDQKLIDDLKKKVSFMMKIDFDNFDVDEVIHMFDCNVDFTIEKLQIENVNEIKEQAIDIILNKFHQKIRQYNQTYNSQSKINTPEPNDFINEVRVLLNFLKFFHIKDLLFESLKGFITQMLLIFLFNTTNKLSIQFLVNVTWYLRNEGLLTTRHRTLMNELKDECHRALAILPHTDEKFDAAQKEFIKNYLEGLIISLNESLAVLDTSLKVQHTLLAPPVYHDDRPPSYQDTMNTNTNAENANLGLKKS